MFQVTDVGVTSINAPCNENNVVPSLDEGTGQVSPNEPSSASDRYFHVRVSEIIFQTSVTPDEKQMLPKGFRGQQ